MNVKHLEGIARQLELQRNQALNSLAISEARAAEAHEQLESLRKLVKELTDQVGRLSDAAKPPGAAGGNDGPSPDPGPGHGASPVASDAAAA